MGTPNTEAIDRYRRANVPQIIVRFYPAELELYDWVKEQETMAGYVKKLIKEDMGKRKKHK